MSSSPVSFTSRDTAVNSAAWFLCCHARRTAMDFTICAAAPQPFSEACCRSPAAKLLLGLGQEPLAGLLIRLGGHGQSPMFAHPLTLRVCVR